MIHEFTPEQQQFIDECLSNPAKAAWLSKFNAKSVQRFLAQYPEDKKNWLTYGKAGVEKKHYFMTQAMTRADEMIFTIQQKKLFDLQCIWRSEKATVEGMVCTADWIHLEISIKTLDIIPPITQEEIELFKEYLLDYQWSQKLYAECGWQEYDRYIRDNSESEIYSFPSYYNYVAYRSKTPALWKVLPDIRGKKEEAYLCAAAKARYEQSQTSDPRPANTEPLDERPFLSGFSDNEVEFIKLFEDYHTAECRTAYYDTRWEEDYSIKDAIQTLQNAQGAVKIEANADWRQAILRAAFQYERGELVAAIDGAYARYLFNRQLGIAPAPNELSRNQWRYLPEQYRQEILDGREALGEPRDFNF